jgi:hypothetical protein
MFVLESSFGPHIKVHAILGQAFLQLRVARLFVAILFACLVELTLRLRRTVLNSAEAM